MSNTKKRISAILCVLVIMVISLVPISGKSSTQSLAGCKATYTATVHLAGSSSYTKTKTFSNVVNLNGYALQHYNLNDSWCASDNQYEVAWGRRVWSFNTYTYVADSPYIMAFK